MTALQAFMRSNSFSEQLLKYTGNRKIDSSD